MLPNDYLIRVYSGFLGKCIGVRLGAPIEPIGWTYERIRAVFGEITGYVKPSRRFAADDDTNGPLFFHRRLIDGKGEELCSLTVADAWLNYTRENRGMFWWGGEGISTEHTAFMNLKKGIEAPMSGSIEVNGKMMAEQIGGQIFIDSWGLLYPSNPAKAAEAAEMAASVSHDGEGINGARFIAACISAAFSASSVMEIINKGLCTIPENSEYAEMVRAVCQFHEQNAESFRMCRSYLEENWGYDRYPGVCHIIPNAAVCVLALLYGDGDYSRTIEIAAMCGWDTDCNAGNAGTIMGVYCGIDGKSGIPGKYRDDVNDTIAASGISGCLNIVDVPSFAKELALLGYRLNGETAPRELEESYRPGKLYLDFPFPGCTNGFQTSDGFRISLKGSQAVRLTKDREVSVNEDKVSVNEDVNEDKVTVNEDKVSVNEDKVSVIEDKVSVNEDKMSVNEDKVTVSENEKGALEILFDNLTLGDRPKIFVKPFYRRHDFDDERYSPVFTPKVYSGQTVTFSIYIDKWQGKDLLLTPYVRDTFYRSDIRINPPITLKNGGWQTISSIIPDMEGSFADEIGFILETNTGYIDGNGTLGRLFLKEFTVDGEFHYTIDFTKTAVEFNSVLPFSHDGITPKLKAEGICISSEETWSTSYTGNFYTKDLSMSAVIKPLSGEKHFFLLRSRGIYDGYLVGLDSGHTVSLYYRGRKPTCLKRVPFTWETNVKYVCRAELADDVLRFLIGDKPVLTFEGIENETGMYGFASAKHSKSFISEIKICGTV